jgi:hypothetical protein
MKHSLLFRFIHLRLANNYFLWHVKHISTETVKKLAYSEINAKLCFVTLEVHVTFTFNSNLSFIWNRTAD